MKIENKQIGSQKESQQTYFFCFFCFRKSVVVWQRLRLRAFRITFVNHQYRFEATAWCLLIHATPALRRNVFYLVSCSSIQQKNQIQKQNLFCRELQWARAEALTNNTKWRTTTYINKFWFIVSLRRYTSEQCEFKNKIDSVFFFFFFFQLTKRKTK